MPLYVEVLINVKTQLTLTIMRMTYLLLTKIVVVISYNTYCICCNLQIIVFAVAIQCYFVAYCHLQKSMGNHLLIQDIQIHWVHFIFHMTHDIQLFLRICLHGEKPNWSIILNYISTWLSKYSLDGEVKRIGVFG